MNIACTACSARYGVADDKLIGKRVRITCKRCGTVLIVDGNTNPPTVSASSSIAPARPSSSHPPLEVRSPPPAAEPPFTVLFADGRQEQADIAQIVRFHRSGQLASDSLVWREGMAEWTNPWDVTEIAAAFRRMGYARPTPVPAAPAAAPEPVADAYDDEATQIVESSPQHEPPRYEDGEPPTNVVNPSRLSRPPAEPRAASTAAGEDDDDPTYVARAAGSTNATAAAREAQRARRASTQPPRTAGHWNEPGQPATREPAARAKKVSAPPPAARASSRPPAQARARSTRPAAPREDLFARQSRAGSEEEQEAEAAPEYGFDGPRLTGARNETSVLFSLDSLIKKEPPPAVRRTPTPPRDESLLVDSGNSLPVGGGFAPALSAPDFTAPVSAPPPPAPSLPSAPYGYDTDAARSSRAWLYVLVLVAVGGVGVVGWRTGVLPSLLVKAGGGTPQPAVVAVPVAPSAVPSASSHPASPEVTASSSASAEASASAAAAASAAPTPTVSATATKPTPQVATTAATRATTVATRATAAHESSARESAPKETASEESAPKETASKEAAATASNAGPFDTAAAKEALTATAGNAGNCKQADGPTGNGKVSITFAPSGRPTSVAVTGDLAGTTVGSCVARMFRGVKVPPFSGDPVTVAKSFSIE